MTTVPDLAEPVTGWRVWNAVEVLGRPYLASPLRPVRWPARRRMSAVCGGGCPTVPTRSCGCGIYAMTDPARLYPDAAGHGRVVGCAALWGRVIQYSRGVRAEHGYPLVLFVRSNPRPVPRGARRRLGSRVGSGLWEAPAGPLARALADRYAVPVGIAVDDDALFAGGGGPRVQAIGREATRGLADRRAGDPAAHDRLAAAARTLVGPVQWFVPTG